MKEENEDIKKEETVNDAPENETENINAQEASSGEGDAGENGDTAEKTEEKDPLTAAQEEIEQEREGGVDTERFRECRSGHTTRHRRHGARHSQR